MKNHRLSVSGASPGGPLLDRRTFAAGAISATAAIAMRASPVHGQGLGRPNIVFIMADDLGYADLSCTGSHHISTPAIDSIAQNGMFFSQGYANSSICSPTRTALLTGRYQYRFRVGLEEPQVFTNFGVPIGLPTLGSVFRDLGYRTKLVGKWHLGSPPEHGPLQHGYDEFLGIVPGAGDYFRHGVVVNGEDFGNGIVEDDNPGERAGYLTDVFGDEAANWIEIGTEGEPFFLSLHFTAPHWPWEGPEDAAISETLQSLYHYDGGDLATYRAMVESMDANVAKVLAALDRKGILHNTIVVFTSDNGGERFSETWPFVGVKGELLEGGLRVPLLVQWPARIPAASSSEQVMTSMDFLPTLLAMAGGRPEDHGVFDGLDLSAQLTGSPPRNRTLFWRFKENQQAAVRSGDWKYLSLAGEEFLFNLAEDQRERANLLNRYPDLASEMRAQFDEWNAAMLSYPLDSYSEDVRPNYVDRY